MFKRPIKHVPLRSFDDLIANSYMTKTEVDPKFKNCFNLIPLSDGSTALIFPYYFNLCVAPLFYESFEILEEAGYTRDYNLYFENPFPFEHVMPTAYKWLQDIATQEDWAKTYELAYECAKKKGIHSVTIPEPVSLHQVFTKYMGEKVGDKFKTYLPMIKPFLEDGTEKNIGTYIHLGQKSLMVCDEYGRTYIIDAAGVINDIENQLIDAGYTRTPHPELYIQYF